MLKAEARSALGHNDASPFSEIGPFNCSTRFMNPNTKTALRWLVIIGFGGYGIYTLIEVSVFASPNRDVHSPAVWLFVLSSTLVYSGLWITVACFILRRQYRHLCTLVSVLAAVIVFSFLVCLPFRLGLYERLRAWNDSASFLLIALPLSLAALLIPFYGARWAFRRGQSILSRFIPDDGSTQKAV